MKIIPTSNIAGPYNRKVLGAIRDLIKELLNHNLNGQITIQYPSNSLDTDNYSLYKEDTDFQIVECSYGIILGVSDDNK